MNLYIFGTDRKLFQEDSYVFRRMFKYASNAKKISVICFSLKKDNLKEKHLENLHIYPTNSFFKVLYPVNAFIIFLKIYKKEKENVLSSQDPFEIGLFSLFLSKIFNIPIQIQIHTDLFSSNFRKSLHNKIRFIISKYILRYCNRIRVVSFGVKDNLILKFKIKKPIDVLPISVDYDGIEKSNSFDLKNKYGDFKFVLVSSRLTVEKKVDAVIESFSILLNSYKNVKLIICGSGDQKQKLESLVSKLNISENVIFLGWQMDVFSFMKSADLFISLSDFEGYGMSIVEAIFCNCPVITTKVGVVVDFLEDGKSCFFVENSNFKDISDKMYKLLYDKKLAISFSENAIFSFKNTYKIEDYTSKYIDLIRKCIN